jgi:TetR/AcrR family acrAB operon transcriptional repressor
MGRSSRKEAALTRDHILAIAETLFASKGVSAVPLTAIADHAGLTTGAVYWHFANKNELLDALFDREYCSVAARLHEFRTRAQCEYDTKRLEMFCLRLFDDVVTDPRKTRLFSILLTHMELTPANVLTQRFQAATRDLQDTLRHGVESIQRDDRKGARLDNNQAAMFLVVQLIGSLRFALIEGVSEDALKIARSCICAAITSFIPDRPVRGLGVGRRRASLRPRPSRRRVAIKGKHRR